MVLADSLIPSERTFVSKAELLNEYAVEMVFWTDYPTQEIDLRNIPSRALPRVGE